VLVVKVKRKTLIDVPPVVSFAGVEARILRSGSRIPVPPATGNQRNLVSPTAGRIRKRCPGRAIHDLHQDEVTPLGLVEMSFRETITTKHPGLYLASKGTEEGPVAWTENPVFSEKPPAERKA
jgi:hypothetical protein